ncbi:MAG TPA: hypothetical protein VF612_07790 [Jatrophihabitans sp.]|jgi:hypothetical protein|uniref:hypothetical protein n=1 Tax=Jatrophihabitans sp. TaxID=1932789 RepID=UPI002F0FAD9A
MPEPWRRTTWLLLWGWMPAGIGWQLLNADRLDAYSMLGWFVWPAVPAAYLVVALLIGLLPRMDERRKDGGR